ncbi:MAG: LacI family DNA-binding transcriptional regulator [Caulobacterales bacterium]|nr:LacI family DNA-binding transcriptional regulator [Caulobacterales bacterium]
MKPAPSAIRRPTIKEVAKLAGVSFKTVARVVNQEPSVKPEMREAVLRAMKMLNYSPNISARQLRSDRSFLIAMLFDIAVDYLARAQAGAIARCRAAGYHLIVEEARRGAEVEVAERLKALKVDGVILTPPVSQRETLREALRERGLRYVLISPEEGEHAAPSVSMDDRRAAQEMTEHLIGLGHRDIAFISGGERRASRERRAGYLAALETARIAPRPELQAVGDFLFRSGESAARELLKLPRRPTAIFAANDGMALGAMVAAARLGVSVPQELSVAGFDDSPTAQVVWPQLTTIRQPLADMSAAAVDLLLQREEPESPASVLLDFQLVKRDSVGPVPAA